MAHKFIIKQFYEVTYNDGLISVYSNKTKKYLSPYLRGGYHCFKIANKQVSSHHIVTNYFLGDRPENICVNHKNGYKLDNRIENLEYVTWAENTRHSYKNGLHAMAKDIKNNPKYKDGRCSDIVAYKKWWYNENKERILKKAKDRHQSKKIVTT